MSERSFDELSNLTEVAGLCYSPIANDALRRVTSQMLEEADNENAEIVGEHAPNNDNEPSIESKQSLSTPVAPKKQSEAAGSSQELSGLLQELCQYETASDENTTAFEKASQFFVIVSQNADLHVYGVPVKHFLCTFYGEKEAQKFLQKSSIYSCASGFQG